MSTKRKGSRAKTCRRTVRERTALIASGKLTQESQELMGEIPHTKALSLIQERQEYRRQVQEAYKAAVDRMREYKVLFSEVCAVLRDSGMTVEEISKAIGSDAGEVRAALKSKRKGRKP